MVISLLFRRLHNLNGLYAEPVFRLFIEFFLGRCSCFREILPEHGIKAPPTNIFLPAYIVFVKRKEMI